MATPKFNQLNPAFEVELPAMGTVHLQSAEEVDLWNRSAQRYREDYMLAKTNDLVLLGILLQQQIEAFRAQRMLNGMIPELDNAGVPTGKYIAADVDSDERDKAMRRLTQASDQIQKIEKALGIDKVSREAGGQLSVANYLTTLKHAAHLRGIHITEQFRRTEKFRNELSTMLRMLDNLDAEDRAYHGITDQSVLQFCRDEIAALAAVDQEFAHEQGKLYVGKL
jgi:hypothetical protein